MAKAKKKKAATKKGAKKPVKKVAKKMASKAKSAVKKAIKKKAGSSKRKSIKKIIRKKAAPKPKKTTLKPAARKTVKKKVLKTAPSRKELKTIKKKVRKAVTTRTPIAKVTSAGVATREKALEKEKRPSLPKTEPEKPASPRIFDEVYVPVEPKPKPQPTFIPVRQMPDVIIPENKKIEPPAGKTRYSDEELQEFKQLIERKLAEARQELENLQAALINMNEHGTDDTGTHFKMLEDGSEALAKEEAGQLAMRQRKYVEQLENALKRIENKTYGICRVTGKLIPKERLLAVPHTTQSIEAKMKQYGN